MKKKVNVFGKSIPVLAIFVLGIALVSAALVPYLSNTITGNAVIDSPFMLSSAEGDVDTNLAWGTGFVPEDGQFTSTTSLELDATAYGGYEDSFWVKAYNQGTESVAGYMVFEINCDEGVSYEGTSASVTAINDFDVNLEKYEYNLGIPEKSGPFTLNEALAGDFNAYAVDSDSDGIYETIRVYSSASLGSADEFYIKADLAFKVNAHGDYTIKVAMMDDFTGVMPA